MTTSSLDLGMGSLGSAWAWIPSGLQDTRKHRYAWYCMHAVGSINIMHTSNIDCWNGQPWGCIGVYSEWLPGRKKA